MNKQLDWKEIWSDHWWGKDRDIGSDMRVIEKIITSEKQLSVTETIDKVKEMIGEMKHPGTEHCPECISIVDGWNSALETLIQQLSQLNIKEEDETTRT